MSTGFWEGYVTGAVVVMFGGPLIGRPIREYIESVFPWRVRFERKNTHA